MSAAADGARRLIGRRRGTGSGPTLLVVAAIHGNEPAGVHASRRVLAKLETGVPDLRGEVVCVVGNVGAFERGVRQVARDMNRGWDDARVAALRAGRSPPGDAEDAETAGLDRAIEDVRAAARGDVVVLDLHTTSGDGPPFSIATGDAASRAVARTIPLTCLTGLLELLDRPMLVSLARRGIAGAVVEAGRNDDPASVDRAEAAIWVALAAARIVDEARAPWIAGMRRLLESARGALPVAVDVFHRHAIRPGDGFRMEPGFRHFDRVDKGRLLATDARGDVVAPEDGYVLMPLYQGTGSDGFFLGRGRT